MLVRKLYVSSAVGVITNKAVFSSPNFSNSILSSCVKLIISDILNILKCTDTEINMSLNDFPATSLNVLYCFIVISCGSFFSTCLNILSRKPRSFLCFLQKKDEFAIMHL